LALIGTDPVSLMKVEPADARELVIGFGRQGATVQRRAARGFAGQS
jgi:hypothetical protein